MVDSITEETPNGAPHCPSLGGETINPAAEERQVPSRGGQDALRMGTTAIYPFHKEPQDFAKLCAPCYGLFSTPDALRALTSEAGYLHFSDVEGLERVSTGDCPFCKELAKTFAMFWSGDFKHLSRPTLRFWAMVGKKRYWEVANGPADWEQRQTSATKHLSGIQQACIPLSHKYQFDRIGARAAVGAGGKKWYQASFSLFAQHGRIPWSSRPPWPTNLRAQTLTRSSKRIQHQPRSRRGPR